MLIAAKCFNSAPHGLLLPETLVSAKTGVFLFVIKAQNIAEQQTKKQYMGFIFYKSLDIVLSNYQLKYEYALIFVNLNFY
jgi:hypothetical protein